MKKSFQIAGIFCFAGFLSLGWLGVLNGPNGTKIKEFEGRNATEFPGTNPIRHILEIFQVNDAPPTHNTPERGKKLIGRKIEKQLPRRIAFFYAKLESALDDRVLLKYDFLALYSRVCAHISISAFPEKVILGKNSWLFIGNSYDRGIDKFLGKASFSRQLFETKIQFIKGMQRIAKEKKIPFVFVIAPDKTTIYPEYLPEWARKSTPSKRPSRTLTILARRENLEFLHLEETLLEAKQKYPGTLLYYHQDSHWNRAGAWHGFEALMKNLKKQNSSLKIPWAKILHEEGQNSAQERRDIQSFLFHAIGENASIFDNPQVFFEEEKDDVTKLSKYHFFYLSEKEGARELSNNRALNRKHLLFIRDSFGAALTPYLLKTFAQITSVHNVLALELTSFQEWVEETNPDVILYEIVERRALE